MPDSGFGDPAFDPPQALHTDEFVLRPLLVSDTELDYEAVMETREFLRVWAQECGPKMTSRSTTTGRTWTPPSAGPPSDTPSCTRS